MKGTKSLLIYAAITLVALVAVAGGLFSAGYAFTDLSPGLATALTAAWLVPLVALSVAAVWRPDATLTWLVGLSVAVMLMAVVEPVVRALPERAGPVMTMVMIAMALPIALLGRVHPLTAGVLMLGLAVMQLVGSVLPHLVHGIGAAGPGMSRMLTGSSGIVVVPMLVAAVLLLAAGWVTHDRLTLGHAHGIRHAH